MAKDMKTRKGKDNIYYPYTSPDLVIDSAGESQTTKNNNMKTDIDGIKTDLGTVELTTTAKDVKGAVNELNTKIGTGGGVSYDDTAIKADISSIKTDLGTAQLETTAKDVKGAINEVNKKIGTGGGAGTSYDDTQIKNDINAIKTELGTDTLTTTAQNIKGAVNEVAAQCKDLNVNGLEKMNSASLEIFNKSSYMEKITPTINNNVCVKLDGTMHTTTPEYKSLEFDVQNINYIYVKNLNVVKASDDYCLYCIMDSANTVLKVIIGENQTLNEAIFIPANGAKIRFTCSTATYTNGEVFIYTDIKNVIDKQY